MTYRYGHEFVDTYSWDAHGCNQRRLGGNDTTACREQDGAVWFVGTAALHRFEGDRFTGIAIQEETPGLGHIGLRAPEVMVDYGWQSRGEAWTT